MEVSYIYPVIMGTGVYRIDGRRLGMLTVPFSLTQSRLDEDDTTLGVKWTAPITLGYDQIGEFDWLDQLVDGDTVTASIMPGVQLSFPLNDTWTLRPFASLGFGHDFVTSEVYALGELGVRLMGRWELDNDWEMRWGAAARIAGEYQFKSGRDNNLGLLETGLDLRRDTQWEVMDRRLNAGVYYRLRSFQPKWTVARYLGNSSELKVVHEVGVSLGLTQPRKLFGYTLRRVRLGYHRGPGFRGWTMGTEFPF